MNRIVCALTLAAALTAAGTAMAAEKSVTLAVKGMYCAACPFIVKQSLAKIGGVANVAVSVEKQTATVTYDDGKTNIAALTHATTQAGYPSQPIGQPIAAK